MQHFDNIILGTGQATGTLLGRLIPTGESIAVIEGARIGGSCVNYGCTPTKTLVASARAVHTARRGTDFGLQCGTVAIDFARVRERMNEIRGASNSGLTEWMESAKNVQLLRGWGRFENRTTLRVANTTIKGRRIFINTGTRPVAPPIEGLNDVPWLDSERLLDLETLPRHLLIIGGGYIGLEFAQIFRRFGAEVSVFQHADQLMPREDRDIAEAIREILGGEGITIHCNADVRKAETDGAGLALHVHIAGHTQRFSGSHVLVAAGRRPNSDTLNLAAAGIAADKRGFIQVDEYCRSTAEGVYALGDVNGHGAFTHTAVNDAEIALDHIFGGPRTLSDRIPVYALFTDPPLGRAGMSEKDALNSGRRVLKATKAMSSISRAKEMGETQGFAKILVDAESDEILGAAILGPGGDEVINMFAVLMHHHISARAFRTNVLVHPTISELMPWTLDSLEELRA